MTKHFLSILAFIGISVAAISLSRTIFHSEHYHSLDLFRTNPLTAMLLLSYLIQGAVMTISLTVWRGITATIKDGIFVALAYGVFAFAITNLADAAELDIPSIPVWIIVETGTAMIQFSLFGLCMGWLHQRFA